MARTIDREALLKELTCDFTGTPFHGNKKVTIGEVRRIIESMPTLTPQNEWVSVEERLPENGQIVLFHQKDGFIYCAEYFAGNALMSPGWFIDNDSWDAKEVTHWMSLPEAPDSRPPEGDV